MSKPQLAGVELELTRPLTPPIKRVSDNGNPKSFLVIGMQPELVSPPGDWNEFDPGVLPLDSYFFPVSDTGFTVNLIVNLDRPVVDIEPKGQLNGTVLCLKHAI